MRYKLIFCPCVAEDCPYYFNGECAMDNPMEDCDDFGAYWDEDDNFLENFPRNYYEEDVK